MSLARESGPADFEGEVLTPTSDGYDAARRVWNAMVDRRPSLIVRPRDTRDVARAVRFARSNDLEISVRGGGHSVVGHAVTDGGVMIDLSSMRAVALDADARRAAVQGGALLHDLDAATVPHGRVTPAGVVSHTGVGGLTLGGGEGYLGRKFGLTCDSLVRAEVVTAAGEIVVASEADDADLLWALRGGGGNFGIVTEFTFELHAFDPRALSVDVFFAPEDGPAALAGLRDLAERAPEESTMSAWAGTAGPWPFLPERYQDRDLVALSFIHVGDPGLVAGLRAEMRAVAPVVGEAEETLGFAELQASGDEAQAHGKRRYWKSHYLRELSDAAIAAFLSRGRTDGPIVPNGSIEARGGAQSRVGPEETAFANRDAAFSWVTMAGWDDPAEDEARMGAARRFADAMAPHASGVYVNAMTEAGDGREQELADAYRPRQLARLARLKARYDPGNVFHLNQNVAPA